jgi:hypothetical protein
MAEQERPDFGHERDEVSHLYQGLARDEPPARLDAAIRNEARRALAMHPAPLVPPTGRRTWYFPFAAAAVIVLAVAVTWQMEREQGDPVGSAADAVRAPMEAERKDEGRALEPKSQARSRNEAPQPKVKAEVQAGAKPPIPTPTDSLAKQSQSAAAGVATAPAAPAAAPAGERAEARVQAFGAAEPPERWLERIAVLREQGRQEEADRQLAEFRKRYPDFRIAAEMLKRVEKAP